LELTIFNYPLLPKHKNYRHRPGPHAPCGNNYWTLADAVVKGNPGASVTVTLGVPSVLSNDTSGIAVSYPLPATHHDHGNSAPTTATLRARFGAGALCLFVTLLLISGRKK
jgi:hypothetical protein